MESFLIALALAIVGFFITKAIEGTKRDNELRKNAGLMRFESYKELWHISEVSLYTNNNIINKQKLLTKLKTWYYDSGNGLWIYIGSSDILISLILKLKKEDITDEKIAKRLSDLRTQLKVDVMTYTKKDAEIQLGNNG